MTRTEPNRRDLTDVYTEEVERDEEGETSALKFITDLTGLAFEHIQTLSSRGGDVIWDMDEVLAQREGKSKLCIVDTGMGYEGKGLVAHVRRIYERGILTDALRRNPRGLFIMSWKGGNGVMCHVWQEGNDIAFQSFTRDKQVSEFTPIPPSVKPKHINITGNQIVMLGESDTDRTVDAPPGHPRRWIVRYLNTHIFKIPEGVSVKCREMNGTNVTRRTVQGQFVYLEAHKVASGTLEIPGALAHWWLLADTQNRQTDSAFTEARGHLAILHNDGLYSIIRGRAVRDVMVAFGVVSNARRVVVYIEPHNAKGIAIEGDSIKFDGKLSWEMWGEAFKQDLPPAIFEDQLEYASKDYTAAIKKRLDVNKDCYQFGNKTPLPLSLPNVRWVSRGTGSRKTGELEDRAARYNADKNTLIINEDFVGFKCMRDHWTKELGQEAAGAVKDEVHQWYQQALQETVAGLKNLSYSSEWGPEHVQAALSEEALTAVCVARYHVLVAVKRGLGTKVRKVARGED